MTGWIGTHASTLQRGSIVYEGAGAAVSATALTMGKANSWLPGTVGFNVRAYQENHEAVEDADGKRYMDMLAAYSAVNFGHCHPELIAVAKQQLDRVTLTSRAFHNDQLGPLCKELAELCSMEAVLPTRPGLCLDRSSHVHR